MAIGFKVADGYVEVHARYDKNELRRAAENAADDNDRAYNKERERNAKSGPTRDSNRRIGKQANEDFVRGVREQVNRQKENPFIHASDVKRDASKLGRVHVQEFGKEIERETDRRRGLFRRIGVRISDRIKTGLTSPAGAGAAGAAFFTRFIESVSFGQADMSQSKIVGPLSRAFAIAGTTVGAIFAGLLVAEIAAAITAATPILLGGLLAAIPMISLLKSGVKKEDGKWVFQANAMGKALKKLSGAWKEFKTVVSAPFQAPLIMILDHAGDALRRLQGPWAALVKSISPGMVALFDGIFGAIESFIVAIGPAMPGVTAGLKTWGQELPKIGKALGEFFVKLMSDPAKVQDSVRNISLLLRDLLTILGFLVPVLTTVGNAWSKWGNGFRLGKQAGQAFITWARGAFTGLKTFMVGVWSSIKGALTTAWNAIKNTAKTVWGAVKSAVSTAVRAVSNVVKSVINALVGWWKSVWHNKFVSTLRNALGLIVDVVKLNIAIIKRVIQAGMAVVKAVWTKVWNSVKTVASVTWKGIKSIVSSALNAIKGLFAPALNSIKSRVSQAWNSIKSTSRAAWNAVRQVIVSAWNAIRNAVQAGVSRVVSLVRSLASRVKGALAGAGTWLYSAGRAIIQGLLNGINSMINSVRSKLQSLTALIKASKGPPERDRVLLFESGQFLMQGLMKGIDSKTNALQSQLGGLTNGIPAMAAGGPTYHNTNSWNPTIHVHVQAGLETVNSAAKRALTKEIFLALEQYRKDYVR